MKKIWSTAMLATALMAQGQVLLNYDQNQTPTYNAVIQQYQRLDKKYPKAHLREFGPTDSGHNLHVFFVGPTAINEQTEIAELISKKAVILINNGIHPGESCGIDASLKFAENLLEQGAPQGVVFCIVPVYNIGGCLNRGSYSRANQLGPEEHGFRGNARNLDLNRDFIKADALNTLSFYAIFQALQPHVFIDTHTSNGADYQYTMTLISTQKDKLNPVLSKLMTEDIEPFLYNGMSNRGWEMTPYVNVFGDTPDKGFAAFLETPRYASGYTSLFNTIGFITEAHMLKPYKDRVEATLSFLNTMAEYAAAHHSKLREAKKQAFEQDDQTRFFDLNWEIDSTIYRNMPFKGYGYEYLKSEVSGADRLQYNAREPKTYPIKYFDSYQPLDSVALPRFYLVPAAWKEVPLRLQYNNVAMIPLKKDTALTVTSYHLTQVEFANWPYEGHFPIKGMQVQEITETRDFYEGDYLVPTDQKNRRFIAAVLEPIAVDSYLRWNFYDEVFQQKEHFSPYVFEETATGLLSKNSELKQQFEEWKKQNPTEASNGYQALLFIYRNSDYYEKEHLRYPVARIE